MSRDLLSLHEFVELLNDATSPLYEEYDVTYNDKPIINYLFEFTITPNADDDSYYRICSCTYSLVEWCEKFYNLYNYITFIYKISAYDYFICGDVTFVEITLKGE